MQNTFVHSTIVEASCEELYAYHEKPELLYRIRPPWEKLTVVEKDHSLELGTMAHLRIGGKEWIGRVIAVNKPYGYTHQLIQGPLTPVIHEHIFNPISSSQTEVIEKITYTVPFGKLGNYFLGNALHQRVEKMMIYRHKILQEDLKRISLYQNDKPLKILLTGSSGFVGSHLLHLLPLFNHQVFTLVRRTPLHNREIYWDPVSEMLDQKQIEGFDALIHLGGETLGVTRWTAKKKQAIYESRIRSTQFLVKRLNALYYPPKTFLCASAIGFYGDPHGQKVDENTAQGKGFLADLCYAWEESARHFTKGRVVSARFGVVLGPDGGMLKKIRPLFKMGCGASVGRGDEWCSWISLEDVGYQIIHLLRKEDVHGAVNLVTPYPVTSQELAESLGKALHKSVRMRIPRKVVKLLLGEMGDALLLSSIQAMPNKLQHSGAVFAYPTLAEALKIYLGS